MTPPRATLTTSAEGFINRQLGGADQVARRARQRHVHGDGVGVGEQVMQCHQVNAVQRGGLLGHERVVAQNLHLHAARAVGDGHADLAQADDAQRLAAQLDVQ